MTDIELPAAVRAYLAAPADAVLRSFASDATVTDEGQTFSGTQEILAWRQRVSTEWTLTSKVTGVRSEGEDWIVATHVEGDFPGGVADLEQRFTVRDDVVTRLIIA